jgi:hypothetical protein
MINDKTVIIRPFHKGALIGLMGNFLNSHSRILTKNEKYIDFKGVNLFL